MKLFKRILVILLAFIILAYIATTIFAPAIVDKKFNTSTLLPPYKVSETGLKIYNNLSFVADLHCDALLWKRDLLKKHDYGHVDVPRMVEAKMALQAFTIVSKTPKNINFDNNTGETDNITSLFMAQGRSVGTWFSLTKRALDQCSRLNKFAGDSDGVFRVITSATELKNYINERINNTGITAGYLGVEGMQVLEGDLDNVDLLYDAGVRMMSPVHFFDNLLGGSAHGVSKEGLTSFGREVIKKMEEKQMLIDLSHSSPKLIDDIVEMTSRPLIVSHTGVKGTCNNVRNLSDKHLKAIAAKGGLVGIAFFEPAVCGTNARATVKAIRYTVDLIGIDHVALGSDFDGAIAMHFEVTGLPLLVDALLEEGFNPPEIGQIMGGNTRDFLLKNLPQQ